MKNKKFYSCEDLQVRFIWTKCSKTLLPTFFVDGKMQGDVEILKSKIQQRYQRSNIISRKKDNYNLNNKRKTPCDGCPNTI